MIVAFLLLDDYTLKNNHSLLHSHDFTESMETILLHCMPNKIILAKFVVAHLSFLRGIMFPAEYEEPVVIVSIMVFAERNAYRQSANLFIPLYT